MSLILHIESATEQCSVALSENETLLSEISVKEGFKHNENLIAFIQQILDKADKTIAMLDAVAVSEGPGSYTGLRIGVSTAKGICYALNKPLIAIDTLEIMARYFVKLNKMDNALLLPMIDAKRMEVYAGLYNQKFENIYFRSPVVIDETKANEISKLADSIVYFGNGAEKCEHLFKTHAQFLYGGFCPPQASAMIVSALEKFNQKQFEDLAYFEPEYLKPYYTSHPAGAGLK